MRIMVKKQTKVKSEHQTSNGAFTCGNCFRLSTYYSGNGCSLCGWELCQSCLNDHDDICRGR